MAWQIWMDRHTGTGTSNPVISRFNGAASLVWPVSQLVYEPRPQSSRKPSGQAIPAEPAMLTLLEDRIEAMNLVGDARWSALLGQWLVAVRVVRFVHVKRSCRLRISESTMHCMCPRGRQRRLRGGFLWSVPARFGSGWDWAAAWQAAAIKTFGCWDGFLSR